MEEKDEEKNVDEILGIMKNSYNQYYERSQNVDNKSGFLIAFHAAIIIFVLDFKEIKAILQLECNKIGDVLSGIAAIILFFIILILAITSLCMFIWELKSRNIKYLPPNICDDKYYKCKNIDLKKELLKGYKEIVQYNENIIERKHKIYNIASIITIIEVALLAINALL